MQRPELIRWERGLRTLADKGRPLSVRSGDGRTSALPFTRWVAGDSASLRDAPARPDPDAWLWWCALARDPHAAEERILGAHTGRSSRDDGALFAQGLYTAIEVWTDAELSSLQALWWLSRHPEGAPLRARMLDSARWHLQNTQPDNATNRPWAIPVFLDLALLGADSAAPDALLFAETLLHNALAGNAEPEPFSALILRDAANAVAKIIEE